MTTPTVPVTVTLAESDGTPLAGITVRAQLDGNEVYEGVIVSKKEEAVTDANGAAVLNLFPNAPPPTGLGSQGTTYRVFAAIPGGRNASYHARVPNEPCRLENILVSDAIPPLSAAELAVLQAQAAIATAADSAATASANAQQTALDRTATGEDRVQTGLDRTATGEDRAVASTSAAAADASRLVAEAAATSAAADAAAAASSEAQAAAIVLGNFLQTGTGAVARTYPDKVREEISVFDFMSTAQISAIQAGTSTDDTAEVQKAVTAAAGRRLKFPKGTYRIAASRNTMPFPWEGGIKIPSNSHLEFDPGAVIQVIPNALEKYYCFSLYAVENVVIQGGSLIGDRTTHTYPNVFDGLADLTSNNYRTKDNYNADPPVWADGAVAYVYKDIPANNGTYTRTAGSWVRTSASLPNYITHEFGFGIGVENSKNVWIDRVRLSNFTGDGIYLVNNSAGPSPAPATETNRVFITGCDIDGCRRQGISIVKSDDVIITGNTFRNIGVRLNLQDGTAPRAGIDIESGGGGKSDRVTISGNSFFNCTGGSVFQYDGNSTTITGNVMDTVINYGFGVNTTISGNVIYAGGITANGARVQIDFTYTQAGTVVTATTASAHGLRHGDQAYFEFLDANGLVIHHGLFTISLVSTTVLTFETPGFTSAAGNGRYKYRVNNISITGNTLYGGALDVRGNQVVVSGNAIMNPAGQGIYVFGDCIGAVVADNNIDGTAYGINGATGYSNVTIQGNRITNCTTYGIRVYGTNSLVVNNHITRSAGGITVSGGTGRISGNYIDLSDYPITPGVGIATAGASTLHEISENTIRNHNGTSCMSISSPARLINNRVLRWTSTTAISISGANSDGAIAIGNIIECNRSSNTAVNVGLLASSNTKFRAIGNVIYSINAAMARAIDTSGSSTSRITNNVYEGAINSAGTDTLTGNVAY